MAFWPTHRFAAVASIFAALLSWDEFTRKYLPFILLAALLVPLLIKARRVWEEIREVEEPILPGDLLEAFEQAHADGEIDDKEFERIRLQLKSSPGPMNERSAKPATKTEPAPAQPQSSLDRAWNEPERRSSDLPS